MASLVQKNVHQNLGDEHATGSAPLAPELLRELKRLHFQTRRLADEGVAGRYRSAFRGSGIEFEEVREYVPGDDIRQINWKVTARSGRPYIKSYREERELTVIVAVDLSASTHTATRGSIRATVIAKIAAVLTLIAVNNNDKVGLVTFSDRIESYHPPRKARSAVWRILHEVMSPRSHVGGTNLTEVCSFLHRVLKRRAIVFLVSDFFDSDYEISLATLAKRHDVTAVLVNDPADMELPVAGLVRLMDLEAKSTVMVDSSDPAVRAAYRTLSQERLATRDSVIRRYGVNMLQLATDRPFIDDLKRYLERRRRDLRRVRRI